MSESPASKLIYWGISAELLLTLKIKLADIRHIRSSIEPLFILIHSKLKQ